MPCTTILVGKKASYDGSTMIARNDDGRFDTKKLVVVNPKDQPRKYKTVISHLEIELDDNPCRYTMTPNVSKEHMGLWPANGINEYNVGMTATETITSNPLVLGADPLVEYKKASKGQKEIPGGFGEEDIVLLVLPYVKSAREGVLRLGMLLEKYGTYESNGIAFNDENECWFLESIGGHHWIARRVDDNEVVIMPNQFGLDNFDFEDAYGKKEKHLCSSDLKEFVEKNHLVVNDGKFNPRYAFGSHSDQDHVYNTPRAWWLGRYFAPKSYDWEKEFTPESDNIPWSLVPERKVTVEDIKYVLSSHYQGTEYDPYTKADLPQKGKYRPIGVNRTDVMAILQIRPYVEDKLKAIEWCCFGPNMYNSPLPIYTNVSKIPAYLKDTTEEVSTDSFYWDSVLIGCLADPHFGSAVQLVERYQKACFNKSYEIINKYDALYKEKKDDELLVKANEEFAKVIKEETLKVIRNVLMNARTNMKCSYSRSDN